MEDLPKTKKARIAFLEAKLDRVETDRRLLAMRVDTLLGDKAELTQELQAARQEISDLRHRLAEERAWSEINFEETENIRKSLHSIHTVWQHEMLENER